MSLYQRLRVSSSQMLLNGMFQISTLSQQRVAAKARRRACAQYKPDFQSNNSTSIDHEDYQTFYGKATVSWGTFWTRCFCCSSRPSSHEVHARNIAECHCVFMHSAATREDGQAPENTNGGSALVTDFRLHFQIPTMSVGIRGLVRRKYLPPLCRSCDQAVLHSPYPHTFCTSIHRMKKFGATRTSCEGKYGGRSCELHTCREFPKMSTLHFNRVVLTYHSHAHIDYRL